MARRQLRLPHIRVRSGRRWTSRLEVDMAGRPQCRVVATPAGRGRRGDRRDSNSRIQAARDEQADSEISEAPRRSTAPPHDPPRAH